MLRHLDVWEAAAARPRLPRRLRNRLHSVALNGPADGEREGEPRSAFAVRWAVTVLSVPWMTPLRLHALSKALYSVISNAHDDGPATICRALAQHRHASVELMADCLDPSAYGHASPSMRKVAFDTLEQLEHPWPTFARIARMRWASGTDRRRLSYLTRTPLRDIGAAVDGLDETSAAVLVGILPDWKDTFEAAVTAARDIAGNPTAASVAEHFPYFTRQDENALARALTWAHGEATSPAQLSVLPLHDIDVWKAVASRTDLTTELRRQLVKVASEGPSRMAGFRQDADAVGRWARDVLSVPWLTPTRLTKLAPTAARAGVDPAELMKLVAAHPNVCLAAVTLTIRAVPSPRDSEFPGSWPVAVTALGEQPGTVWGPLARVLELGLVPRRRYDWQADLGHLPDVGRRLDLLALPVDELVALLELLPTWDGDLDSALVKVTGTVQRPHGGGRMPATSGTAR